MRFRSIFRCVVMAALLLPGGALAIAPKVQFAYTGGEQTYIVPSGVVMVGVAAVGGHGGEYGGEGGGREAGVGALLPVRPGQKLFAEVGAVGVIDGGPVFGGGGAAGAPPPVITTGGTPYASSGGGASDVRTCSSSAASCPGGVNSAASRLIVGGGGGGASGSGNGPNVTCVGNGATGNANNFQYPGGNPSGGHPVPIITAAGIVYPANYQPDTTQSGITQAGNGTAKAGFGGSQAGCSSGPSTGWADSVAGSNAIGPVGGTGGDASSLGPNYSSCTLSINNCFDAGAGGGGGGGYFGGGGGATGLDKPTGNCGACNGAGSGLEGGGGSSFTSNKSIDPIDESSLTDTGAGIVIIVPVIEIDAPANGAAYTPGQVVHANWACAYDNTSPGTDLGSSNGCTGTAANGSAIDTSPGQHTFTVSGSMYSNGNHTVSATVAYMVGAARVSITAAKINSTLHTAKFTFKATGAATGFQCALIKREKSGKYPPPSFSSCRSPKTYKHLKSGRYKFQARALSGTRHGTPETKSFRIT